MKMGITGPHAVRVGRAAAFFFFLVVAASVASEHIRVLELERALPHHGVPLGTLRDRDAARHRGRHLQSSGFINFPLGGSSDPFAFGLYFTRVQLGNPPKEFYVQIDTGSDALWVTCTSCDSCPKSTSLNIKLSFFDPSESSTSSPISCDHQGCYAAIQNREGMCLHPSSSSDQSQCGYTFEYGDGSKTSGYYVSDTLHLSTISGDLQPANSSATVLFGCSTSVSGTLSQSGRSIDGIFGFGQQPISVVSQLSATGVAPRVFSHCLQGGKQGGGILVLGEIVEPGIVYTPIVPSQTHYNINMTSIAVNGKTVPIDPSVFATPPLSSTQGTIIDSGTTLAYIADQAYTPFINALTSSIPSSSVTTINDKDNGLCFVTKSRPEDVFPSVTMNFQGGVSMTLHHYNYLLQQGSQGEVVAWCMGWQQNVGQEETILGDIVLKDKIFVYDLANQRIGWKSYNCSSAVNVSANASGSNSSVVNGGGGINLGGSTRAGVVPPALLVAVIAHFVIGLAFY